MNITSNKYNISQKMNLKYDIFKIYIYLIYFLLFLVCLIIIPNENISTFVFYFAVLTCSLLLMAMSSAVKDKSIKNFIFWIGILVLGSVMAFRAQTGIDDLQYKKIFLSAKNMSVLTYLTSDSKEKGYLLLNYFLFKITCGNYNLAQTIISFFSFVLWGTIIRKWTRNKNHTIMFFFLWTHYYFLMMGEGLVRIFIAIPIFFHSLHYLIKGKPLGFILTILGASLFHISALCMLILFPFSLADAIYKKWYVYCLLILIGLPIGFILIARFLVPILGSRYAAYANINKLSISLKDFDMLPILAVGIYYRKRIDFNRKKQYLIGLVLLSLSIMFSIYSSLVSLSRLIFFANLGLLIVAYEIFKIRPKYIIDYLVIIGMILYGIIYMLHSGIMNDFIALNLFPYRSFLLKH